MTLPQSINTEFSYLKDVDLCQIPPGTVIASNVLHTDTVFVLLFTFIKMEVRWVAALLETRDSGTHYHYHHHH